MKTSLVLMLMTVTTLIGSTSYAMFADNWCDGGTVNCLGAPKGYDPNNDPGTGGGSYGGDPSGGGGTACRQVPPAASPCRLNYYDSPGVYGYWFSTGTRGVYACTIANDDYYSSTGYYNYYWD